MAHLITPVYYADLIRKLAAEGPTVFVEVGPQQALTRLNRRILAAAELAGIACDNPSRPGVEQIVRVQALLEACGALDRPRPAASDRAERPTAQSVAPAAKAARADLAFRCHGASSREDARKRQRSHAVENASTGAGSRGSAAASRRNRLPTPGPRSPTAPPLHRRPRRRRPLAAAVSPPRRPGPTVPTANLAELEKFLINFVVEQTGYPPEVVELDADLEADLGIDSIKKAQLFGELQEYFDVTPLANMTVRTV